MSRDMQICSLFKPLAQLREEIRGGAIILNEKLLLLLLHINMHLLWRLSVCLFLGAKTASFLGLGIIFRLPLSSLLLLLLLLLLLFNQTIVLRQSKREDEGKTL